MASLSTNDQDGVLFVVSTPIGNLGDITVRAIDILRSVDLIACEDTRRSRVLLQRWDITSELMSLHRFSEKRKSQTILDRLKRGGKIALISDAGTPAVSDPGHRLVRIALEAGIRVSPIPGPSSITAALSASGIDCSSFVYLGFVPRKNDARRSFFHSLLVEDRTSIFFETPRRICVTLRIATQVLGAKPMVLFRELTKVHEEILFGSAGDILKILESRDTIKGEIIVVVEGGIEKTPAIDSDKAVKNLLKEGFSGKRLADEACKRFGVKKGEAYAKFLEIKNDKKG